MTKEDQISHHRQLAITYLPNLIKDHVFFLDKILYECSETLSAWKTNQSARSNSEINAYFSAYISSFQTIKDTSSLASNKEISWKCLLGELGNFIYSLRNAVTHNGMPMTNFWLDGQFFFPTSFFRLNQKKQLEEVICLPDEISSICIKASNTLAKNLLCIFSELDLDTSKARALETRNNLATIASDTRIDPETRKMFTEFSNMKNLLVIEEEDQLLETLRTLIRVTEHNKS